jgi:hypothetical protein
MKQPSNNAFEADGPTSVALSVSRSSGCSSPLPFAGLRFRPAAQGGRSADRGRSSERGPRLSATCSSACGGRTRGSNGRAYGPPLSRGPR